jgi:hypothetical protein
MADILLSNDDLTVFGGPESISLDLDIGPQGDRGSIIIGVLGDPRDTNVASSIIQETQALDIAIDYQPASPYFKNVFQKVSTGSGLQWTPLVSLKANSYSAIKNVTAANGKLTIPPINVTEIYDLSENEVTSSNFKINYSISGPDAAGPLATTLVVKDLITSQGFLALPLEIKGVEYVDGVWGPITGPKSVHLFITVV